MSSHIQQDQFTGRFISGLCRIWCRRTDGTDPYWKPMTYPHRGWSDCVRIVEDYQRRFPQQYDYEITTDSDICRPRY